MVLRDENILPTKSKRTFETLLFLDSDSCQSNVQKQPEVGLLLVKTVQAILDLEFVGCMELAKQADKLGAFLYKLCKNT